MEMSLLEQDGGCHPDGHGVIDNESERTKADDEHDLPSFPFAQCNGRWRQDGQLPGPTIPKSGAGDGRTLFHRIMSVHQEGSMKSILQDPAQRLASKRIDGGI